ncbi:response regulator transcription factor, partial [Streptomyces pinistramenti]|uniref:response regulator transcription factor n=1 Tax=Streptomyces pinistramenti TaxID=2884812 RepID=UPI001D078EBE
RLLTPTEHHIAQLAAQGHTNRTIAHHLNTTLRNIESHLTHTYRKLQITGRHQLTQHFPTPQTTQPTNTQNT